MAILDRSDISIYYESHGAGPAIILTHGFGASSTMWAPQLEALSADHQVIIWDMRGHGRTDSPTAADMYSHAHTVADIAALLDECDVKDPAVIGGMSLGGYMTLAFNVVHPDRVRALLLVDTGPGYRNDAAREKWNERAVERGNRIDMQGLGALARSPEVMSAGHMATYGIAHAARGMLSQRDSSAIDSLPGIKVPTMVVVGADDTAYLGACAYMADRIPGAEYLVIEDAGHAANMDQPEIFNAAVRGFLEKL